MSHGGKGPEPASRGGSLLRLGRLAWAILGIAGVAVVIWYVISHLMLVAAPLVLAIFPATLLVPVVGWLSGRGLPRLAAALLTVVVALGLFLGLFLLTGSLVISGLSEVAESARRGLETLEGLLQRVSPGASLQGWSDVAELARERLDGGEATARIANVTVTAFEFVTGMLLMVVILFFYLLGGRQMAESITGIAPRPQRRHLMHMAEDMWTSLGHFIRGQLLIALADGVLIGIGLVIVGVPLALPLAILIFFGGLFPIVGALVTGAVAVLVAFADGGLTTGLIVAAIVLAVQQFEGNVMEPWILGESIGLHPLVVLVSISMGAVLLGVLGAFLAVPVATVVKVVWEHTLGDNP
jgi:putative heme transporter